MRPLLVVGGHELTPDSHQVLFVQHNEVVETLSPQGANHSLGNSVRRWRVDQTGDGVDADASGALTKVTAIDSVTIMQQMVWLVAPRCGLDHLSPDPGRAVGLAVTLTWTSSRRPWAMNTSTYSVLSVSVGTVSRSAAQRW